MGTAFAFSCRLSALPAKPCQPWPGDGSGNLRCLGWVLRGHLPRGWVAVLDLENGLLSVSCSAWRLRALLHSAMGTVTVLILVHGLSLASPQGTYEPGKRHWLKVKKDYLNEGAMADTADLVVLGAFYGQGSKGQGGLWPLGHYFTERHHSS